MHIRIHRSIDANAAAFICSQDSFPVTTDSCARGIYVSVRVHRLVSFPDMGEDYEELGPQTGDPGKVKVFAEAMDRMVGDLMAESMYSPTSNGSPSKENFNRFCQTARRTFPKYSEIIPEKNRDDDPIELIGILLKVTHGAVNPNAPTLDNGITLAYTALHELLFWAGYTHFLRGYDNANISDRDAAKILILRDFSDGNFGSSNWTEAILSTGADMRYRYADIELTQAIRELLHSADTPDGFQTVLEETHFFDLELEAKFGILTKMEMGSQQEIATQLVNKILYAGGYTWFG